MTHYTAPFYTEEQLEEFDTTELHYPYSDINATYDGKYHQYELTAQYFYERGRNLLTEISGNDPERVKHFLEHLRLKVYTFIYTHSRSTRNQLNWLIAQRSLKQFPIEEYRNMFLEAMYLEGCYLLDNGDLSQISGIDFSTMQNLSADVIRRQDRDFNKDSIGLLKTLGLNYYGRYSFTPEGNDW